MSGLVQSASLISAAGAVSLAFNTPNKQGNALIIVGGGLTTGKTFTLSDTQGNIYQSLTAIGDTLPTCEYQLFFCLSCKPGANTVNFDTTAVVNAVLAIHEFTPIKSQSGTASATGSGSAIDSGALAAVGNFQFGFAGGNATGNQTTVSGTGWTLAEKTDGAGVTAYLATEWKFATGTQNATFTDTLGKGAALTWGAEIANFTAIQGGSASFQNMTLTPQWTTW